MVVVDISEEAGMQTVNKIKENGGEAKFVKADVTKEADIKNYVRKTIDSYGKIDIFLNNAGWEGKIMPLIDYPTGVFDQLMTINVHGLPHMIEQKSGAVVNTASGAGLLATPNMMAYGASKHAVLGMTKTAGVEVAPHGVRVNAVCPGVVNTAMMRSIESGFGQGDSAAAETASGSNDSGWPVC
ncbi:SDR family NAD(P)-dependent oxidoreductase [Peribacillus frigoritolerans]|uniref:SDR family NAD(P)-dependent oxidoreductase n=1 Tax=Peribacillus frigoritolerans TaxID=450367 RepID=UPI003D27010E